MYSLTKQHKNLLKEIREILEGLGLDYENIEQYRDRTVRLKLIKEHIVRARVIMWYSFVDETLDTAISNYFFYNHRRNGRLNWRSKKYNNFKHGILEKIFLIPKFELVSLIKPRWKKYSVEIQKLNSLRNPVAHSLFPEKIPKKTFYKGRNIFSIEGLLSFENDMQKIRKEFKKLI